MERGIGMELEQTGTLRGRKRKIWEDFLRRADLEADDHIQRTVLIWDNGQLIATGSRQGNLLKCIAVDEDRQGEGITASLITTLRQDAFEAGYQHLFLYTKPRNEFMFSSLFFYPIAKSDQVLLMESRRDGIRSFVESLPRQKSQGKIGAAVMHCNPFTLGHRYLVESAARECDWLYVFVLSESGAMFSPEERMAMVKAGTADLSNVTVLPTGPYLISSATFPTYFLKDKEHLPRIQCQLDISVFTRYFAPGLGITHRFVGTEPFSASTAMYNRELMKLLPSAGIEVREVPRLEKGSTAVSASAVRGLLAEGKGEEAAMLLPETTVRVLKEKGLL
nr:[citrate (pro-3S)-lyase] ligase [Oscillospiraceae bacterium]